ncbi:glycosyltransferase [Scytonema sp. UIC 10036]|uniref:glycosyltransferase n=1 Tax=Scytonema sp. UIC 10036 TaxID=2304196 RepID=UPI0012DAEC5B|nr:glycosyltransferase [Scytonema sp. UIC 10036]MUH01193.1 glycosyltransferase [Scytonema sp. UIC 10036]
MNQKPLVSILINNYNYAHFLRESIDSALNQAYPRIEVVVVDDGSTDNSRDVIKSYENQIVSVLKQNGGQASAFNAGFKASKGDIICFLDADDYYNLNKVSQIVNLFQKNSELGWIFHELDDVDANGHSLSFRLNQTIHELSLVDFREKMIEGGNLPYLPATSGLCFKRSVLEQILPMPEQLLISADNFLRLATISKSPGLLSPDTIAVHRIHGANLFEFRKDYEYINAATNIKTCYYLRKCFPETKYYTNRLYAHAVGRLIGKTSLTKVLQIPEFKEYIKEYFSLEFGIVGGSRIFYNYLKSLFMNFKFFLRGKSSV